MFMAVQERQAISARHLLTALATAGVILLAAHGARAQVSCEDCDECMTNCVCQPDGSCEGTPAQNGTLCDDGNDCTLTDSCQAGQCVGSNAPDTTNCNDFNDCTTGDHCHGGQCVAGSTKNDGDPCTIPGLGLCATGAQCQVIQGFGAFCMPQNFVECADKCQSCDPNTGGCVSYNYCTFVPCSNGQCDSSTGECFPGHEGDPCNDYDVCTSDDRCHDGECAGTAGGTPGPTSTPTATPSSVSGCMGDCNGDGVVTVDEIITGVDIALGDVELFACDVMDDNGDDAVTVDEILAAVNNALDGCPPPENTPTPSPAPPTSTPTRTPTGATVTPSPTTSPGGGTPSIGTRAAGTIESTTSAFLVIPNLLSALLGHLPGAGSGSGATTITIPFTCNSGGGTVVCTQPGFYTGAPTFTVTLNNCQVTGSTGTLTFDGTLSATGQDSDSCVSIPTNVALSIPSLTVQTPTGTATFSNFSAGVSLSCSAGSCSCRYDTVDLQQLTGTITVAGTNTNSTITFGAGSSIVITVDTYTHCVPTVYDMEVNGNITLTTNGNTFPAIYDAYTIHDDASSGHDMVEVSGAVTSGCFGDTVIFSTSTDIALGNPCPSAGVVYVYATTSGNTDTITYSSSGVHIDFGAGGSKDFTTCLDSQLFICPAS